MGGLFSKSGAITTEPKRILMVGLDNAGKTTVLYTLHLGETVTKTVPTIGFNVQTVTHNGLTMSVWDVGGQSKIRGLWQHYLKGTQAVIYVVDSADSERLSESAEEFHNLLKQTELTDVAVLVMANKSDLPTARSVEDVKEALGWDRIKQTCHIESTIATENQGLRSALDWVSRQLGATSANPRKTAQPGPPTETASIIAKTPRAHRRNASIANRLPVLTNSHDKVSISEFKAAPMVKPHKQSIAELTENTTPSPSVGVDKWLDQKSGSAEMSISNSAKSANLLQALILTLPEACEMLKVGKDDVVKLLNEGFIKGKKIGGEWRISTRTILEYLEY